MSQRLFGLILISVLLQAKSVRSTDSDPQLNIDLVVKDIDSNNDGKITNAELVARFEKFDSNNDMKVTRCEWVKYSMDHFGDARVTATAHFDIVDINNDNIYNSSDFNPLIFDSNKDGQATSAEFKSTVTMADQKAKESAFYKSVKTLAGKKVKETPDMFDADKVVSDADSNKDGIITLEELQAHLITSYDTDKDGKVSRCEYVRRSVQRYMDKSDVAMWSFDSFDINNDNFRTKSDVIIKAADTNGDGKVTSGEFKAGIMKVHKESLDKANKIFKPTSTGSSFLACTYINLLLAYIGVFLQQ